MAELTEAQIAWLRAEIGATPSDIELGDRYARLGSIRDVAIEVLRGRRTDMLAQPLDVNVNGVASINYAENVKALERRITALVQLDDDPSDGVGNDLGRVEGPGEFETLQLTRSRGR